MPTLVHLADERESASIIRNGIKIGKFRQGIFCMPVLPDFYVTHQWLREMKRRGIRTFIGIYFKADSKTKVLAGRYNEPHKEITLGEAIREIQTLPDPLGYELIITRKIEPKEVTRIKTIPQNIGWRYKPGSNGQSFCTCDYCIKGNIKASRKREKDDSPYYKASYNELLRKLKSEKDVDEIDNLLIAVAAKRRRSNPLSLSSLLQKNSIEIDQRLALTVKVFRHKNARSLLQLLLDKADADTREFAASSLLDLYGETVKNELKQLNDPAIEEAIMAWRK